jgi:hypothetical protein
MNIFQEKYKIFHICQLLIKTHYMENGTEKQSLVFK